MTTSPAIATIEDRYVRVDYMTWRGNRILTFTPFPDYNVETAIKMMVNDGGDETNIRTTIEQLMKGVDGETASNQNPRQP